MRWVPIPELLIAMGTGAVYSSYTDMLVVSSPPWFPHSNLFDMVVSVAVLALGVKLRWSPPGA